MGTGAHFGSTRATLERLLIKSVIFPGFPMSIILCDRFIEKIRTIRTLLAELLINHLALHPRWRSDKILLSQT